jgi:hypothetical protein
VFEVFFNGESSFIPRFLPTDLIQLSTREVIEILKNKYGSTIFSAFNPDFEVKSPLFGIKDTEWLRRERCVGVNVRTIHNFWNIIPYSFSLPLTQRAIHLLPIWEPGVVASLYGMASWNINPEFYSAELAKELPHLDTVEKQLKVVINILHAMGRVVGMDVVPHTDRYSEQVLANPSYFEWLIRSDLTIVDHAEKLDFYAKQTIFEWLKRNGSATDSVEIPSKSDAFFHTQLTENQRLECLFGKKYDYAGRLERRKSLIRDLFKFGFETAPATMGPPYRGLEVNPADEAKTVDDEGRVWRDYQIKNPQKFSRAFGPLTRYKLYHSRNDNRDWELDFANPATEVWDYVCEKYAAVQRDFGFDFMRGDMSHVQMRPQGVPFDAQNDPFYDLLGAVKNYVRREKPWFGYFAESFLAPPNEMAFGDELDHLEASHADSTLGDLQNESVGSQAFMKMFFEYVLLNETRKFSPNFTILTADKDDPRFDKFYLAGNEIRYFIALFLTDMPSYMALNFECRDPHPTPAPNEHYSKLYVFQEKNGAKSTNGSFVFGENRQLFANLERQKKLSDAIFSKIRTANTDWILRPDPLAQSHIIAWTQKKEPKYLFVANLNTDSDAENVVLPANFGKIKLIFSTEKVLDFSDNILIINDLYQIGELKKGEGLVFEID